MGEDLDRTITKLRSRIRHNEPAAFEDAVKLAEQYPEQPEVWRVMACAHEAKDEYTAAIAAYTRAMELNPRDPALFFYRGQSALHTGDLELAVADFSQSLVLYDELNWYPLYEELYFMRAEAFVQLGKKAEALADLSHVRDGYVSYRAEPRSKADLLVICGETPPPPKEEDTEAESVDGWELPETPNAEEAALAAELGPAGLDAIDATLIKYVPRYWRKVAMVLAMALEADGVLPKDGDSHIELYLRRLIMLADAAAIEWRGNLRRPRFSEVALPDEPPSP